MKTVETGIPGLLVVEPQVFGDERGWFMETHHASKFAALGIEPVVQQINQSFSTAGVLRGLHFQSPPQDQTKLVRCIRGRLFDVAVDIRAGSPTFGQWFGVNLSADNKKMLYVPSGFAHGFYAATDCELLYLCGKSNYDKSTEGGLVYDDPAVGIGWPFAGREPQVNPRDASFPTLDQLRTPFVFSR
ncbi:MAG: dTDP-4-dehydrorhamnose 3,5-epimerase [Patescibacteria group bacterium]|jgi:dTDP-4-dehydrorhamnose 3,5-epimerase